MSSADFTVTTQAVEIGAGPTTATTDSLSSAGFTTILNVGRAADGLKTTSSFNVQEGYIPTLPLPSAVFLTTAFLPSGYANVPYSRTLQAIGGALPYTWSLAFGSLPAGLSLDASTGEISGVPTTKEMQTVIVRVADSAVPPRSATRLFTLAILDRGEIANPGLNTPYNLFIDGFVAEGWQEFTWPGFDSPDFAPEGRIKLEGDASQRIGRAAPWRGGLLQVVTVTPNVPFTAGVKALMVSNEIGDDNVEVGIGLADGATGDPNAIVVSDIKADHLADLRQWTLFTATFTPVQSQVTVFLIAYNKAAFDTAVYFDGAAPVTPPSLSSNQTPASPGFVEIRVSADVPDVLTITPDGGAPVPMIRLPSGRSFGFVPLSGAGPTDYTVRDGLQNLILRDRVTWSVTDLTGRSSSSSTFNIRQGDSLLLTATGTGAMLEIDADGDGVFEFAGVPGQVYQRAYAAAGSFTATAKIDGIVVGSIRVNAVSVNPFGPTACQVGIQREKSVQVNPPQAVANTFFTADDTSLMRVGFDGFSTVLLTPLQRGAPVLIARLDGATGPILAYREVDEFTLDVPAREDTLINDDTDIGTSVLTIRPYVPGLRFEFNMFASQSTFGGGVRSFSINTSQFTPVFDPATNETVGEFLYDIEVPDGETIYCFNITGFQAGSPEKTIATESGVNGRSCKAKVHELTLCVSGPSAPLQMQLTAQAAAGQHDVLIPVGAAEVSPVFTLPDNQTPRARWAKKFDCNLPLGVQEAKNVTARSGTGKFSVLIGDTVFGDAITVVKVESVTLAPATICADGISPSQATAVTTPPGRQILWSIIPPNLGCTIDLNTGLIRAGTTGGTVTVRASDYFFFHCYAEATLTLVNVESVTVAPPAICADGVSTAKATPVTAPPDRPVLWRLIGPHGCTIDAGGIIHQTADTTPGTIIVRAVDAGLPDCGTATAFLTIVKVVSITFTPPEICADHTSTAKATPVTVPPNRPVLWTILGDDHGCTIDAGGIIHQTANTTPGTIVIRAVDAEVPGCDTTALFTLIVCAPCQVKLDIADYTGAILSDAVKQDPGATVTVNDDDDDVSDITGIGVDMNQDGPVVGENDLRHMIIREIGGCKDSVQISWTASPERFVIFEHPDRTGQPIPSGTVYTKEEIGTGKDLYLEARSVFVDEIISCAATNIAGEPHDFIKVSSLQFSGPQYVPDHSRYNYRVTPPVAGTVTFQVAPPEAALGQQFSDTLVELFWQDGGAEKIATIVATPPGGKLPTSKDVEIIDVTVSAPDNGIPSLQFGEVVNSPAGLPKPPYPQILMKSVPALNAGKAGNPGSMWAANVKLTGPHNNKGIPKLRTSFIQNVTIVNRKGLYLRGTLSRTSSVQARSELDILLDTQDESTVPWYSSQKPESVFFDPDPVFKTQTNIFADDSPSCTAPLTWQLGSRRDSRDDVLESMKQKLHFVVYVCTHSVDIDIRYVPQAKATWDVFGDGDIVSRPGPPFFDPFFWVSSVIGRTVDGELVWTEVNDGFSPVVTRPTANSTIVTETWNP